MILFFIEGPWCLIGDLTGGFEALLKALTTWTETLEALLLGAPKAWLAISRALLVALRPWHCWWPLDPGCKPLKPC